MSLQHAPVLLVVDGNSLTHRAFHANARSGLRDAEGRPQWAVQGLISHVINAIDRSCADAVVVGFDDPDVSVRRARWPDYKAQRPDKPAGLDLQLRQAPQVLADLGIPVVIPAGLEADDVLASAAAAAPRQGVRTVLVTSDRDAFALIDDNTRVLRLINGGAGASPMLTSERLKILTGVLPHQYRDLAALRGDPADNLPGVTGVGRVMAARLLGEFGSGQAIFDEAGTPRCRSVVGPALSARLAEPESRTAWQRNVEIMSMHTDVPVDWEPAGRLPLEARRVREILTRFELPVRPALRILTESADQPPAPDPRDEGVATDPKALEYRVRRASTAAAPRQLTLFS